MRRGTWRTRAGSRARCCRSARSASPRSPTDHRPRRRADGGDGRRRAVRGAVRVVHPERSRRPQIGSPRNRMGASRVAGFASCARARRRARWPRNARTPVPGSLHRSDPPGRLHARRPCASSRRRRRPGGGFADRGLRRQRGGDDRDDHDDPDRDDRDNAGRHPRGREQRRRRGGSRRPVGGRRRRAGSARVPCDHRSHDDDHDDHTAYRHQRHRTAADDDHDDDPRSPPVISLDSTSTGAVLSRLFSSASPWNTEVSNEPVDLRVEGDDAACAEATRRR